MKHVSGETCSPADTAGDAPPPAPGTLVRARVTHSAEYDLAATIVG